MTTTPASPSPSTMSEIHPLPRRRWLQKVLILSLLASAIPSSALADDGEAGQVQSAGQQSAAPSGDGQGQASNKGVTPPASLPAAVAIPGGTFVPRDTPDRKATGACDKCAFAKEMPPRHGRAKERIPDLLVQLAPVTAAQYAECVQAGGCASRDYTVKGMVPERIKESGVSVGDPKEFNRENPLCNYSLEGRESHPMNCLSQDEAAAYCRWVGGRLPSEGEWEYAATHDGQKQRRTVYPWGNQQPAADKLPVLEHRYANYSTRQDKAEGTTPVGMHAKGTTVLGLADMAGNVHEWTSDTAQGLWGVVKGGSFGCQDVPFALETGAFAAINRFSWLPTVGFRCVWEGKGMADIRAKVTQDARTANPTPETSPSAALQALSPAEADANLARTKVEFVPIPAGSFVVDKKLPHLRFFTSAFQMARTPVTVEDYLKCVEAGACAPEHHRAFDAGDRLEGYYCNAGAQKADGSPADKSSHPMNCVDRDGADAFCRWIGGRLPTVGEWKYAASHDGRKNRGTKYPWGNKEPEKPCTLSDSSERLPATYCVGTRAATITPPRRGDSRVIYNRVIVPDAEAGTAPVGTYGKLSASPLGLMDLIGNVAEWAQSAQGKVYHCAGQVCEKIIGGGWRDPARGITWSDTEELVDAKVANIGFRCVRDR